MKKKLSLIGLMALLFTVAAFSQNKNHRVPLVAEDEIKDITVGGNIHVLLVEDQPANIGAQTLAQMVDKLRIDISGDHLTISPSKKAVDGEELYVYVRVNDLRRIELKDNATVTSYGVLNSKNLNIIMNEKAKLAVRSNGEVQVKSERDFQLKKENGYYSVFAMGAL